MPPCCATAAPALDRLEDRPANRAEPSHCQRILRRQRLSRIRDLEPKPAVHRYEHARLGDQLPLDIERLGRVTRPSHRFTGDCRDRVSGIGWEYLHLAVDDRPRIAASANYPDEKSSSVLAFLVAAFDYCVRFGFRFRALLIADRRSAHAPSAQACRPQDMEIDPHRALTLPAASDGSLFLFLRSCSF